MKPRPVPALQPSVKNHISPYLSRIPEPRARPISGRFLCLSLDIIRLILFLKALFNIKCTSLLFLLLNYGKVVHKLYQIISGSIQYNVFISKFGRQTMEVGIYKDQCDLFTLLFSSILLRLLYLVSEYMKKNV